MKQHTSPNNKKYGAYFQQDEQGRDIYYLWGNAGDCWYVNRTQKIYLKISYVITGIAAFLAILTLGLVASNHNESITIIIFNAAMVIWLSFFFFYSKKMEMAEQKAPFFRKPKIIKDLSIGMVVLTYLLILGFLKNPSDPL